jgi:hypothetical protein
MKHITKYLKKSLSEENTADYAILKPTTHQPNLGEMCKNKKQKAFHSIY